MIIGEGRIDMKHKYVTFFLASLLLFSAKVRAEDDVFVDLSVLDSLGNYSSPRISNQPLFPSVAKKAAQQKKQVKAKKTDKVKVKKVADNPKKDVVSKTVVNKQDKKDAEPTKVEVVKEDIKKSETVSVAGESVPDTQETSAKNDAPVAEQAVVHEEKVPAPEPLVVPENVVNEPAVETEDVSGKIYFEGEDSLLTEEQKSQLDSLSSSFSNKSGNRIGIYAFNFDDGQDMFKKKRQCLNRALEVRAYLMDKGFRTFSVKVVNVTDDSSKKNLVVVEEIK